jgi:hypothetical protein
LLQLAEQPLDDGAQRRGQCPLKAYVCVYRHRRPKPHDRALTEAAAEDDRLLRRYLKCYDAQGSVIDWGDDPSFFAAGELLGDVRRSTWGVCRADVRASLSPGDFVVFVCARELGGRPGRRPWDYHFVGVATLGHSLRREDIWSDPRYTDYRRFLNVLAKPGPEGRLEQHERVMPFHKNWEHRCSAPYWAFDPDQSALDVSTPTLVAHYDGTPGSIEAWGANESSQRLKRLLLKGTPPTRGLRSTNAQRSHPKLSLSRGYPTERDLIELRAELLST